MNETLLVNRSDFSDVQIAHQPEMDLAENCVRLEIGPFALTANNITYMAVGDLIGYWKFFDPKEYGMDAPDMGRMPVWGYGKVTQSKCESVEVGTQVYGFFPVAQHIDVKPIKITPLGFQDGVDHRLGLHAIYNSYTFTGADPSFSAGLESLQPILRPLFTTSFLIDDFFADNDYFGAEKIIIISASSKTALGTAFCLKNRGGVKLIGLTSDKNIEFVESTGFYDEVVSYDDIACLSSSAKIALIDMAGNGEVNGRLYQHFGARILYNCMVGKSHWQGDRPPKIEAGAPPTMFFAPDQAKKRIEEWGGAGFAKKMGASWLPFCDTAVNWLTVENFEGHADLLSAYHILLDGQTSPDKGQLFTL